MFFYPLVIIEPILAKTFITLVILLVASPISKAAVNTVRVASGLSQPVFVTAPKDDSRLFIVERAGAIKILEGDSVLATPFLDISGLVSTAGDYGFFGLAFSPDYAISGLFYVYYINNNNKSIVGRYQVSGDPNIADPAGENVMEIVQPFVDHNGGTIAFSPVDGFLYIGLGDGGGLYDPDEQSQNPLSLLGKMLRIDVSGGIGTTYSVPAGNPFVSDPGILNEIWAFGFRNPYRWSFDRLTGDIWIGDVGQNDKEEINFEPAGAGGLNYGWDVMEGTLCVSVDPAAAPPCNDISLTLPFVEYEHDPALGCSGSINGGYVYRGPWGGDVQGDYFYSDFCTGKIWSLDPATIQLVDRTAELTPSIDGYTIEPFTVVGFGEGGTGELYIVDLDGEIFRIEISSQVPVLPQSGLAALALLILAVSWRRTHRE